MSALWKAATSRRTPQLAKIFLLAVPNMLDGEMSIDWPHANVHRLGSDGIYMVTAATLHKEHLFENSAKITLLERCLLSLAKQYEWQLEAWAVFPNHYHFVARGYHETGDLKQLLTHLHADTARELNRVDGKAGRRVWFNFWDTKLTYERSYLARLNYVHQNPVKHGLVAKANQYRWCSAAWFERVSPPTMVKSICSFKTDKLNILDDFDCSGADWSALWESGD